MSAIFFLVALLFGKGSGISEPIRVDVLEVNVYGEVGSEQTQLIAWDFQRDMGEFLVVGWAMLSNPVFVEQADLEVRQDGSARAVIRGKRIEAKSFVRSRTLHDREAKDWSKYGLTNRDPLIDSRCGFHIGRP